MNPLKGLIYLGPPPCCVEVYKYILYRAAKKLIKPKGRRQYIERNIVAGKIIISPKRLIEGGAAILITEKRNHQRVNKGRSISIPLLRKRLRVLLFS